MEPFWFLTAMIIMIPVLSDAHEEKTEAELPIR
jgi:hypothetical protein